MRCFKADGVVRHQRNTMKSSSKPKATEERLLTKSGEAALQAGPAPGPPPRRAKASYGLPVLKAPCLDLGDTALFLFWRHLWSVRLHRICGAAFPVAIPATHSCLPLDCILSVL